MRSFAHIPITCRATSVIAVFCCTWSEAHVLTVSLARRSWTLCSFSRVLVFGLHFDFLQNKHWSGRIVELTSFLSLELLLGALPVAASSDGSLATCKSLLLVNSAQQLRWYFMGFAGSSLLVEASKTGLWFRIMAARYNGPRRNISTLGWCCIRTTAYSTFIRHLLQCKRNATQGQKLSKLVVAKQGPQKRKHPYFVFLTLYCRVSIFRKKRNQRPLHSLFLRTSCHAFEK